MKPVGIFSERDFVSAIAHDGSAVIRLEVRQLMSSPIVSCRSDDGIDAVLAMMLLAKIRHVPVIDGSVLRGIVSLGDLVMHRLDEKELEASVCCRTSLVCTRDYPGRRGLCRCHFDQRIVEARAIGQIGAHVSGDQADIVCPVRLVVSHAPFSLDTTPGATPSVISSGRITSPRSFHTLTSPPCMRPRDAASRGCINSLVVNR